MKNIKIIKKKDEILFEGFRFKAVSINGVSWRADNLKKLAGICPDYVWKIEDGEIVAILFMSKFRGMTPDCLLIKKGHPFPSWQMGTRACQGFCDRGYDFLVPLGAKKSSF